SSNMYTVDPTVIVSPFAAPFVLATLTVPVPYVPFCAVRVSVLAPFWIVIVWPEVDPVPENVPVAVAPVANVVRVNVLELPPAVLLIVSVGAVAEVASADTVPTTVDAVPLVVKLNTLAPF